MLNRVVQCHVLRNQITIPIHIRIDGAEIVDWDSFHTHFAEVLGFPKFYGRNMDAWNDCMTYLDDSATEMSVVTVPQGDFVVLCIDHVEQFRMRCPEIFDALIQSVAFVNFRRIEQGEEAILSISYNY